jgi:hypothetical protein
MKPTSSIPTEQPSHAAAQADSEDVSAGALFTWLSQLKAAEDAEEEPARYASPPCYLAEFSAES